MKLRNAVFYVKDVEKSKQFYKSIGLTIVDDYGQFVTFKTNDEGVTLAINLADIRDKVPGQQTVIFEVIGIEEHYKEIVEDKTIRIYKELIEAPFGKTFSILDVDGNKIVFTEGQVSTHIQVSVSVIVVLIRGEKVYLFKRKNTGWADGDYTVPSGHVDTGETPVGAAIREAKEETGVTITPHNLKAVHSDFINGKGINFTFVAEDWDGEARVMENDRAENGEWFSLDDLPENIAGHGKIILENIKNKVTYHEIK